MIKYTLISVFYSSENDVQIITVTERLFKKYEVLVFGHISDLKVFMVFVHDSITFFGKCY